MRKIYLYFVSCQILLLLIQPYQTTAYSLPQNNLDGDTDENNVGEFS